MKNSAALAKRPDRREEVLLGRISPNEAEAFSMRTAKRSRFFAEIKEIHSESTSSLRSGRFGRRLPQNDIFRGGWSESPPEKFCRVARGNSQF